MLLHFLGATFSDLTSVVEDRNSVGNIHDHSHVVFDQNNRRVPFGVDVENEARDVLLFFLIHPAHGLVEEQHLGLKR